MDDIREELEELEIENYEQKSFVTYDALKGLLSENKIISLIKNLSDKGQIQVYQQEEIIALILRNGLRLFAILLSLSRPELILKFIETDHFAHVQLDSRLPLSLESIRLITKDERLCTRFDKHQWRFLAPFFHADRSHRELQDNVRLPFVRCEELGEGGLGKVDKITLPASCQDLVAQVGENRPPGFDNDNDILQALYELASAIEAVHDYFSENFNLRKIGCHYDLKPDNILYRSGKLILSDFGLSRMNEEKYGSKSLYRNGGGEYMAPECVSIQDSFRKLQVGRSSDMWSFGCILSEMLTYIQEGPPGIMIFSESRIIVFAEYWTCKAFHGGDKPHEGVVLWLSRLKDAATTEAQDQLMATIRDLLQIEPSERPRAHETTLRLFYTAQHELYTVVEDMFQRLLPVSDLELQVECERFRLWGEHTGIRDDLSRFQRLQYQNQWKQFADLQMIREGLCKLRLELERLSRDLESTNPMTFRPTYHLQKLIDELWDMQSSLARVSMTSELENRLLSTDEKTQLESIEASFGPAEKTSEKTPAKGDTPNREANRRIGLLAAMKQIASGLENDDGSMTDMRLDTQSLKRPLKLFHWHHTGIYQPPNTTATQVLIEHLEYDGSWSKRTDELILRVQDIASFHSIPSTKSAFPVLTCAGFYHDLAKHVFNIVYNFPPRPISPLQFSEVEMPMSLRDILSTVKSRSSRPSLDHVFAIASRLISIVVTMHKASWLHKNISSFNIIFFPDRFTSIAEAMTSPYFIGFNHSRLNLEKASTSPPNQQLEYRHPEYLEGRKRFCQEYEYYSVGLVLLELGFWVPLTEITEKIPGSPGQLKEALIKTRMPILKTYMGNAYAEAVTACLSSDFGESSKPAEVREAFERKVLQRIEKGRI